MAGIYNTTARPTENHVGKINNAGIYPIDQIMAAGIDPRSVPGLTAKKIENSLAYCNHVNGARQSSGIGFSKDSNRRVLRIQDEQDAINSITWLKVPHGLNSNLMERILYYRGQACFFYLEETNKYYFLPFALGTKGLDCYGRYKTVIPLPFTGSVDEGDKTKAFLPGLELEVVYDVKLDALKPEDFTNKCVIIQDYSPQLSQNVISRQILNEPILDLESDMLPFARTALLNSTGVMGMRVQSEDEQANVEAASRSINRAALEGKKYVPIVGQIDFQELTGDKIGTADAFLMTMQSIDNYRASLHGLESNGIFQKSAHMLSSENAMNASKSNFVMQDRVWNRQHKCDIINSIWGLDMWCDASEIAVGVDQNLDGSMYETPELVANDMTTGNNEQEESVDA